ncbi:spermidine synthase-like protein [Streptomyces sp. A7024]|uniref:Spermidine synthase-like protein n=1 Tax=Streptomyces coryli TaxID=1128680 RepID=A0A6G4TTV0_9ACTN|nr:fused MFS/spermidine synthase [Streptomyces coryli]NGN62970.1 spermidine synthase-like protein [Streptomyces coryli]
MTDEPIPVTAAVDGGTAKLLPDVDRPNAWLLTVDGAPQSYVDLDDPTYLEFEYARRVAHVIDATFAEGRPLDVLHLGGGALTLPRRLVATRPGSRQLVVDNDRPLLRLITDHLPLPADSGVTLLAEDARTALEQVPAGAYDLIIADVYGGSRSPARIASAEYALAAATALRPDGIYIANLADSAPFRFLGSQLANAAPVFAGRCLIAEPGVLRGRRFGNALLVAAHQEPEVGEFARRVAADPFPARVVHGASLDRLCPGAQPVADADAVPSPEPPRGAFTVG